MEGGGGRRSWRRGRLNDGEVTWCVSRVKLIFDFILLLVQRDGLPSVCWHLHQIRQLPEKPQDSPNSALLIHFSTHFCILSFCFRRHRVSSPPSHILPLSMLAGSCSVPSALRVCPLKLWQEGPLVPRFICYGPASKSAVRHLQPLIQSHCSNRQTDVQLEQCKSLKNRWNHPSDLFIDSFLQQCPGTLEVLQTVKEKHLVRCIFPQPSDRETSYFGLKFLILQTWQEMSQGLVTTPGCVSTTVAGNCLMSP